MPSNDEIRDVQRATWAGLSSGWDKWDSVIVDQLGPVGTAIIERLDIADDQRQGTHRSRRTPDPRLDLLAPLDRPGHARPRLFVRADRVQPTPKTRDHARNHAHDQSFTGLIPLTRNEIRRLFAGLTTRLESVAFRLDWSVWRRHHQAVARACHFKRRAEQIP